MLRSLIFLFAFFPSLYALQLNRVILSTDSNPLYLEFWPVIAPLWEKMGFIPTLALIAEEDCPIDTTLGEVIRFAPLPGIPTSLQAQSIRLLLPVLFPDDGCLISDIDMIPISGSYFHHWAIGCPDEAFLVYRDNAEGCPGVRYPMCYVAAKGRTFASLFSVQSPMQIPEIIKEWSGLGFGWNTDELVLYSLTKEWERNGGELVCLGHKVEGRLDRGNWNIDFQALDISKYIDCHCPRPYSANQDSIDRIVEAIWKIQ